MKSIIMSGVPANATLSSARMTLTDAPIDCVAPGFTPAVLIR